MFQATANEVSVQPLAGSPLLPPWADVSWEAVPGTGGDGPFY